jgi:putative endonuclease
MTEVTQGLHYYVYILLCKDGSYYTGHAKDVERRLEIHRKGRGAKYTRIHEPERLVYVERFESRGEAMRRERQIKTLSHDKKQQLIANSGKSG